MAINNNPSIVAFSGAANEMIEEARRQLQQKLSLEGFGLEQQTTSDYIYFISGGSEQQAIRLLKHGTLNLLVAGSGNNAWAAATEVKAYAMQHSFQAQLIAVYADDFAEQLRQWLSVKRAFDNLSGQRVGLIGKVSEWLVASAPESSLLRQRFGIELVELDYDALPDYLACEADPQFSEAFPKNTIQSDALASISGFLKQTLKTHKLDALTLQCFRMVKERGVTACLPVALMNYNGVPAGCEGDLVSIAGIMFLKALTGHIAWMANMVKVDKDRILLAHCTAPLQYAASHTITSHYETDLSAALQAELSFETVTILRMNEQMNTAFLAIGEVIQRPNNRDACRTQIEVRITESSRNHLINNPLGNHHLVLPGDFYDIIQKALLSKGFEILS